MIIIIILIIISDSNCVIENVEREQRPVQQDCCWISQEIIRTYLVHYNININIIINYLLFLL